MGAHHKLFALSLLMADEVSESILINLVEIGAHLFCDIVCDLFLVA